MPKIEAEPRAPGQPRTPPQFAIDAVMRRRGRVRVFEHLDPDAMALLVIDMQEFALAPGSPVEVPAARAIVPTLNRLAGACRRRGVPVIWVTHATLPGGVDWLLFFDNFMLPDVRQGSIRALEQGSEGTRIYRELEVAPGDVRVEKCRFSAFSPGASRLDLVLRSLHRDTVIVTGTKTNICCESTARDAMMLDYKVIFVSDGTAASTDWEHEATLANICQNFGDVMEADELIALFHTPAHAREGAAR